MLYTPLLPSIQHPSKASVDVTSGSAGEVIGALVVFTLLLFLPNTSGVLFLVLAGIGSVIALFLIRRLHRSCVGQLRESLRAGRVSLRPEQALLATTAITIAQSRVSMDREMLIAQARAHAAERGPHASLPKSPASALTWVSADVGPGPTLQWVQELCSVEPERALRVLKLGVLTAAGATEVHRQSLGTQVLPLLADDSMASTVRKFLADRDPRITGQLVDELDDPAAPSEMRSQLTTILGQFADPRTMRGAWPAASNDDFALRMTSVRAAARNATAGCAQTSARISIGS